MASRKEWILEICNESLERFCGRFPSMEEVGVRKGHAAVYIDTQDLRGLLGQRPVPRTFTWPMALQAMGFNRVTLLAATWLN